jgi:hypothetical protein
MPRMRAAGNRDARCGGAVIAVGHASAPHHTCLDAITTSSMTHSTRAVIVTACFVAMLPVAAQAQSPIEAERGWAVTALGGLGFPTEGETSPSAAVAGAFSVTQNVAVEGDLGHAFDVAPGDSAVDSSVTTVHGSVLYFFTTPFTLAPYVGGGLGIARFSQDVESAEGTSRTEIGFNAGGGVTYPLRESLWLRGDLRVFKHIDNLPVIWRLSGGVTIRVGL